MYKIPVEKINTLAQAEVGELENATVKAAKSHVTPGETQEFYLGFSSAMDLAATICEGQGNKAEAEILSFLAGLAATEFKKLED